MAKKYQSVSAIAADVTRSKANPFVPVTQQNLKQPRLLAQRCARRAHHSAALSTAIREAGPDG